MSGLTEDSLKDALHSVSIQGTEVYAIARDLGMSTEKASNLYIMVSVKRDDTTASLRMTVGIADNKEGIGATVRHRIVPLYIIYDESAGKLRDGALKAEIIQTAQEVMAELIKKSSEDKVTDNIFDPTKKVSGYKIYNYVSKRFSDGKPDPEFDDNGKYWHNIRAVKAHLASCKRRGTINKYTNCVVVQYHPVAYELDIISDYLRTNS